MASDETTTTLFSSREFVEAWARGMDDGLQPVGIPVEGSGGSREICGIAKMSPAGLRSLVLGPAGLYASPGWSRELENSTMRGILSRLRTLRTTRVTWSVRFDHEALARNLESFGWQCQRRATRVLPLLKEHAAVFRGYSDTTRRHVRRAARASVSVRHVNDRENVAAYYAVHERLARQKGGYGTLYPLKLFLELVQLRDKVRLLVAEWQDKVIGGGLFLRDGCSVIYWHGASDRDYSHRYPAYAVMDAAIRWACEMKAAFFNFGGSLRIESIDRFKASWGAQTQQNWRFEWRNPLWRILERAGIRVERHAG